MFALMFALARMASAAWVGAAVLFVVVAVKQTTYYDRRNRTRFSEPRRLPLPQESTCGCAAA